MVSGKGGIRQEKADNTRPKKHGYWLGMSSMWRTGIKALPDLRQTNSGMAASIRVHR
jgi:hypothetical protein